LGLSIWYLVDTICFMESSRIYNYLERLSELLRVDSRQAGATHGLQPVQLEALHYLSMCNRFSDTPMAVTDYLGQTKGTVSQTLKVLEKKQLLEKIPDTKDRRIFHLKVTVAGKHLLEQTIPTPAFARMCENLSEKEQADITASLKLLLRMHLVANKLKSFGVCKSCCYNRQTTEADYFCQLVGQPLSNDDIELICREHEVKQ